MVYTVTLNPALDYVMQLPRLTTEDINRAASAKIFSGGKGTNVSIILKRLGIPNAALGFAAGFTGKRFVELLREDGIDSDFTFLSSGETRINVKIKADVELDVNAEGPAITEEDISSFLCKLDKLTEGDTLVLAGSIPKTLPSDIYERILARIDGRGVRCVVDATGELLLRVLKYKPFLVKPNHHELGELFGVVTKTDEEVELYARRLKDMGAKNVLVSRGKDGALLVDENGKVSKIGIVPGKIVSSSGCGDSMVAGFVAGYEMSRDCAEALHLGAACGNATAFSEGLADAQSIRDNYDKLKLI